MELVTGRTGTPHVTSQQDRMLNQGTFGAGTYILNTGQLLEPQVQSSNEIRIRDGAIMVQGALGCIKVNTYDSVTIQNGNQGMQRIDLIVWQYTYDAEQDVESADWVVIQGTPAESDPQQPLYTSGDIQEGDELVQIPVFGVHLDGINVTEVKKLLSVSPDIPTLNAYLSDLSSKIPEEDNGYLKFVDGTLIQWGSDMTSNTNAVKVINLQIPFINNSYFVTYQFTRNANTVTRSWIGDAGGNEARTEDNFGIYLQRSSGTSMVYISWAAIGRWK